jgi:uncharacterized membrane protein YhaH (DUF805 family)
MLRLSVWIVLIGLLGLIPATIAYSRNLTNNYVYGRPYFDVVDFISWWVIGMFLLPIAMTMAVTNQSGNLPKRTMGRGAFLLWWILAYLSVLGVIGVGIAFGIDVPRNAAMNGATPEGVILALVATSVFLAMKFPTVILRLRDIGWPRLMFLILVIPFVGAIFDIVLLLYPGSPMNQSPPNQRFNRQGLNAA